LPRERRWVLIRDVQRKYDDLCVKEPKEQLAEMDAASLKRKIDTKEKEVRKIEKRFKKYNEFLNVAAITEAEEIEEADDVEALRNQIRLRTHVYQMKVVTLIGDGQGVDELERLRCELAKEIAENPLPPIPPPPAPVPFRPAHPAPTAAAVALDKEHSRQIAEAWAGVCELTNAMVFQAPRATRPKKAPCRQDPSPRDQSLVGVAFSDSSVNWRVVTVSWCPADKTIVVWYCDIAQATTTGVGMEAMKTFVSQVAMGGGTGPCPSCLEFHLFERCARGSGGADQGLKGAWG
jgi:hypothetical protein